MDLIIKWLQLESSGSGEFRQLRFPGDCHADLYIAVDADNKRCLVLYLPEDLYGHYTGFRPKPHANLEIKFTLFEHGAGLVIVLTNPLLAGLFDDLIYSLYKKIAPLKDPKKYTSGLINTYWEWASFFEKSNDSKLSKEEVKGIAGEMFFLQVLLNRTPINKNEVVQSWCGLYGDDKDFILGNHAFEVKAISSSGHEIKISSEYQLEPVTDKELCLVVIELDESDHTERESFSLKDKYHEIKADIVKGGAESDAFIKAMAAKGINDQMLEKYEHYRFLFKNLRFYDAGHTEFPALRKSEISEGLKNISYRIELGKIAHFHQELDYQNI
jgi:hypothetical protein